MNTLQQRQRIMPYDLAILSLQQGHIIAYPTEAVYGLGCDPLNESAVLKLLALKKRSVSKGLILIAATVAQLTPYIAAIPTERMQAVLKTWPGPTTWLFPTTNKTPAWVTGDHHSVAVRVTAHPIASALCNAFGRPLVSTSANLAGTQPARDAATVHKLFADQIAVIIAGEVGPLDKPTPIYDAITGAVIRT